MAHHERLASIEASGHVIIDATRSGPQRRVPQYPGWTLGDLLRHVARIHARTAKICTTLPQERIDPPELIPGEDLVSQAEIALAQLLDALVEVDPDAEVWTFGHDNHARFWERRMVVETGLHRWDAAGAAGAPEDVSRLVATDGLDEIESFYLDRLGDVPTIQVVASDIDQSWIYGKGAPVATVHGSASDLFLRLMARPGASFPSQWESAIDALAPPAE